MQRRLYIIFFIIFCLCSCAKKGLITEKYVPDFYSVPSLLPDSLVLDKNPTFILYGDNRQGWRADEKFVKSKNWCTWKMLIFPFYELYWLGNGVVGGINWLRNVPDYGRRERRNIRDALYAEAQRSQVDFIFNSGDIVADGRRPEQWAEFLKDNKFELPLLLDYPFLPMVGNHERANDSTYGLANYEAIFSYPQFYKVEFPDAAFFVVDSDIIIDQYERIEDKKQDQLFEDWFVSGENKSKQAWLEQQFANCNKKFKIVFMHHPPLSFSKHHGDWCNSSYGNKLPEKRRLLLKLFERHGVKIVFTGHEHLYEHNVFKCGTGEDDVIHIIVSGGGGVPLRDKTDDKKKTEYLQNYRKAGLNVLSIKQEKIFHYCLVEITAARVKIKVFEVTEDDRQQVRLVEEIAVRE